MIALFELYDGAIARDLGVDLETYNDVIENKCTYWEGFFIISVLILQDEKRMEKAKNLFNSKLCN
jgi:hypothetical protein